MPTEHEIRRQQAVTRWREGVRERAQYRTRDGSVCNNRTDSEYVAEYLDLLVGEVERLRTGLENIAVMNETDDCERLRNTARAVLNGWETTRPPLPRVMCMGCLGTGHMEGLVGDCPTCGGVGDRAAAGGENGGG